MPGSPSPHKAHHGAMSTIRRHVHDAGRLSSRPSSTTLARAEQQPLTRRSSSLSAFPVTPLRLHSTTDTVFPDHGRCLQKPNCPFINNDPPLMCPFLIPLFPGTKFIFSEKKGENTRKFSQKCLCERRARRRRNTETWGGGMKRGGGEF
jgi:hypothetical protein